MVQILLGLLTDAVLEAAASARHSFTAEMNRYFEERGLAAKPAPRPTPAR